MGDNGGNQPNEGAAPAQPNEGNGGNADAPEQQVVVLGPETPAAPTALTRLKDWLRRNDHVLGRILERVHEACGMDPVATFFILVAVLFMWMMNNPEWARWVSHVICYGTYPLFESIAAVAQRDVQAIRMWTAYWLVYDSLRTFDMLSGIATVYWPAKVICCAYLYLPPIRYIRVIYDVWLGRVIAAAAAAAAAAAGGKTENADIPLD